MNLWPRLHLMPSSDNDLPVPEVFAEARKLLDHARKARARAEVEDCKALAERAYTAAWTVDDHETMYQARACLGRMHRYRGEHELGYTAYRAALREAEVHALSRWLGPAHHDCFVEAMLMNQPQEESAPHAAACVHLAERRPEMLFAFWHDFAYLRLQRNEGEATFLHHTAAQAAWHAGDNPFERMCLFASQAFAAGTLRNARWYESSRRFFEHAVGEMGGNEEGVAMQMLDAARGAERIGDIDHALDYASSAYRISSRRGEGVLNERAEATMLRLGVMQVPVLATHTATVEIVSPCPHLEASAT